MKSHFTCFFCTSDSNRKCRNHFYIFSSNIAFKWLLEKLRLPCHENILNPVHIKIEPMMGSCCIYLKHVFFKTMLFTSFLTLVLLCIMNTCEYKLYSKVNFLTLFLISDGILCGTFGLFYYVQENL